MTEPVDALFAALADPTRRAVVESLARQGAASATQLAARFPISRQAVAKHLGLLEEAGLVTGTRLGRELRYELTPAPLEDAMAWMVEIGAGWDRRLAALAKHLKPKG
ncbi:MAG: winged helix-turn-helix transcriptional regulator [Actinobacteria bacterium]|nr:winged helix-turn-helix transcriptional regulator [Actinomycetota bacterium]MBV8960902.1 winged helix-turn-helix transcriptional regulator [Actinomycetota bacterium]MBV9255835.1 winged helix-turn-helix transcriptional regulator [Actinomycetota bacterium]MBV9662581.1 winged helix-turn-helix transcriptional regulator [Actinomycetota bacterium]MBV9934775.1 winged helix-turn-helix transcriptional regulator [Actinomycetota bacterium]